MRNKRAAFGKSLLLGAFLMIAGSTVAQNAQVLKGRVVDTDGNPIAGAIVNVAEQSRIALSDENGYFALKNVKQADELNISSVGYLNATAIADFNEGFQIVMEADLDEYVHTMPVPFGRKEKKLMTEATSVVSGEVLQKHPITVLQNAFTSTVNGVQTYEWSSEPGWTETAMYIRGIRTMNKSARSPLVIVDNVERDLSFLDAFPIENITILKDAAATAIYGMRGANGAIIVTTKRGAAGKTKIDFTQEIGFQTLSNKMENQNAYNMTLTRNQVKYLSGQDPMYTDEQIEMYRRVSNGEKLEGIDQYRYFDTNWFDELYRDAAPIIKTNLQISGGNARARYYVSFSYLRQEGMWNNESTHYNDNFSTQHVLNRYNLRSNIDIDVTKHLNVSLDLGGRIDNINQPTASVFNLTTFGAVEANPMEPVYCPNGEVYYSSTAQNPLYQLAASGQEKNRRRNLYATVNVNGDLSPILDGLKVFSTVSFDAYETFESTQRNSINTYSYDYMNMDVTDVSQFKYTRTQTYSALTNPNANQREYYYNLNFNAGLGYNHNFGKHNVDARAFIRTYQHGVNSANSSERFLSYNGQLTYNYGNRYILSGNVSHMASDNFSPEERWGTFYGGSLGWVASEESWMKNLDFVNLLKLRASYGRAGRQGDPGASQFYLSLEDDLMRRFGSDRIQAVWQKLNMDEDGDDLAIQSGMLSKQVESAQKRVEGNNYDTRKNVLEYDEVMREQREVIYGQRMDVIQAEGGLTPYVKGMMKRTIERQVAVATEGEKKNWNLDSLLDFAHAALLSPEAIALSDLEGKSATELVNYLYDQTVAVYDEKTAALNGPEQVAEFEKVIILRVVDNKWTDHIDMMDHLRQGVGLRAYAQTNPLTEYQTEGYERFQEMIASIEYEVTRYVMKAQIRQNLEREQVNTTVVKGRPGSLPTEVTKARTN